MIERCVPCTPGAKFGGGVAVRRSGLPERTTGSVAPRTCAGRPLMLKSLIGAVPLGQVVATLARGELRDFGSVASSLAPLILAASLDVLEERESLNKWLTAAQSSGLMSC